MTGSRKEKALQAREAALQALVRFEKDGAFLNLVLPPIIQNLPQSEQNLARKIAAGTIEHLNTIDWVISLYSLRRPRKFTPWIRNLLRLGVYQLLYLDRVPDYAVINETVNLARRYGHQGVAGLVNALLRRVGREKEQLPWPSREAGLISYLSIIYSLPAWFVERAIARFGAGEAEAWAAAVNVMPALSLRPNLMKTNAVELAGFLEKEGWSAEVSTLVPPMVRVAGGFTPVASAHFKNGFYTVQGESSALVAPILSPQPGARIVDLCSAPGGKTTHLAELMQNQGRIYAVEKHSGRLHLVDKAARRLGLTNIVTVNLDGRQITGRDVGIPEAVLVDAPCSGLGVIGRLPEIKWRRNLSDLKQLQKLQLELLTSAAALLPKNGSLVYSVCSTEYEETLQVVEIFNKSHKAFTLTSFEDLLPRPLQGLKNQIPGLLTIWPHHFNLDGFFIARWIKKG